jgi:hypothetical protein
MSDDERRATEVRILHLDLGGWPQDQHPAYRFFQDRGTTDFTAGWVKGPNGDTPSDGVVAAHFLWIHANTPLPKAGRFLMDGSVKDYFFYEDEEIADVGEILVGMFERGMCQDGKVSAHAMLAHMDNLMLSPPRKGYNLVKLGRVLAFFCGPRGREGRRRVNVPKLRAFAKHTGMPIKKLKEVACAE